MQIYDTKALQGIPGKVALKTVGLLVLTIADTNIALTTCQALVPVLYYINSFNPHNSGRWCYHYLHLTDEETEVQRS